MKHLIYFFLITPVLLLTACESKNKVVSFSNKPSFTAQETYVAPGELSTKRRIATGFFVSSNGHFITNYHVIKDARQIFITTISGERVPARVISENKDIDIVLAKAECHGQSVSWGRHQNVDKGEGVLTIGYPLMVIQGPEQKATFGRINSFSGIRGDSSVYQIDVPVQPGNSGGPLISENGVVIGVIKATFNQMAAMETLGTFTQNISYAVKSDQILPMLQQVLGVQVNVQSPGKNRFEMPKLIAKFEKSIVMVEAE